MIKHLILFISFYIANQGSHVANQPPFAQLVVHPYTQAHTYINNTKHTCFDKSFVPTKHNPT